MCSSRVFKSGERRAVTPRTPGAPVLLKNHPSGPLGFECSQHRQTLRPTLDGTRSKALRSFGSYADTTVGIYTTDVNASFANKTFGDQRCEL